ncbi:MAG: hypothetical protein ACRD3R_08520, partial [Terriglobales bacterium]
TSTVTLPIWLFVILALLAVWALLERLLVPGVRWYLRRKVNRVIREINTRLNVELPQFKLARRQALIDRLFHDSKVQDAIARECGEKGLPRAVVAARVDRYAREIVPAFNAYFYFGAGYRLGKALAKLLYRVRLGYACVNFGKPLSMRDHVRLHGIDFRRLDDEARHREVERVGIQVMDAIAGIVPVLPVSLVATVFLRRHDAGWSELELKSAVYDLILRLEKAGAHIYVPRGDLDYAIGVGLHTLLMRRIVVEQEGLYRANPAESALLSYYANAIEPLVAAAGGPQSAPPVAHAA